MAVVEKLTRRRQLHGEEITAFCCTGNVTPLEGLHHAIQIVNRYQDAHIKHLPFDLVCVRIDVCVLAFDAVTQIKVFGQLRGDMALHQIIRKTTVNGEFVMARESYWPFEFNLAGQHDLFRLRRPSL